MLEQENRLIAIATPLGDNELALYKAEINEELARPFSIDVELVSENDNISLDDIMGQNVTIRLDTAGDVRFFNGYITEFHQLPNNDRFSRYGATIRPWLWLMDLSENCRIFQEKSYPDIVQLIFNELGFSDYENKLTGTYQPQEYVVQFNESDFNFVTRLMEQEGIYYYFEHADGKHTLILSDDSTTLPNSGDVEFHQQGGANDVTNIESITKWENYRKIVTGGIRLSDFDFETPSKNLEFVSTDPKTSLLSSVEKFNYPGKYKERGKGTEYVRLLMEKENVAYETKIAKSNVRTLSIGSHFTLKDHHRDDQNSEYLITKFRCNLSSDEYISNANLDDSDVFSSEFTAIPSAVVYRPQVSATKPKMVGPQTAMVVGKAGEEIWTDKYGRVKVHFHWDRYGKGDEQSSCWIRVAQTWAGKNWGQIQIPRIGQEVLVDFLGGDPDRPIIVGSVYNGSTMPPYDLPANATQSGIKTRSTKGGNASNFNEIRFEDEKGSEELYMHAEKDQNTVVENDHSDTIGRNRMIEVGVNHTEIIGEAMSLTVGSTKTELVNVNSTETVGVAKTVSVGSALMVTVGAASAEVVGAAKSESVGASKSVNVALNNSLNVGGDSSTDISKNSNITVGKDQEIKVAGKHIEEIAKEYGVTAKEIQLTAKDKITFKVGKASITMLKNGDITVKGKKINIKGSGDIVMKGSKIKEN
ncbi:MAG: type VI secretion system tip protein VgrG [Paraglaciecola sp.]|uniref:type VI secretion system Vgr family protein n=1 Tax=Paraglaciecola sp. TaxID=1920173 RepID=UPI003297B1C2